MNGMQLPKSQVKLAKLYAKNMVEIMCVYTNLMVQMIILT